MGGAKAENILIKMDKLYPTTEKFDAIYAFVGVNNLTVKTGKMVEMPTDTSIQLKVDLKKRAKKVVICQIVGLIIITDFIWKGYGTINNEQ